jgi:hypothetical protein
MQRVTRGPVPLSLFFIDRNNENANLRVCAVGYGGLADLPAEASAKAGAV